MKVNKKRVESSLKFVLLIVILILTFLVIRSTYSKYFTQTSSQTDIQKISTWNIKLYDKAIKENTDFSENIEVVYDSYEHIAEGVVVPTSTGHFNVKLESTGTDIPYKYEITLNKITDVATLVPDYKIVGYSVNDGRIINVDASSSTISGTVLPKNPVSQESIIDIKIFVEWYDVDSTLPGYTDGTLIGKDRMDNFKDANATKVAAARLNELTSIPVYVTVSQVTGGDELYNRTLLTGSSINSILKNSEATRIVFGYERDYAGKIKNSTGILVTEDVELFNITENGVKTAYILSPYYIYASRESNNMFKDLTKVTEIIFDNFDTTYVETMDGMFQNCSSLTSLDLSNFTNLSLTTMKYMFKNCSNLTNLQLGTFDATGVTDFEELFSGCKKLAYLDLSKVRTANLITTKYMFSGCSALTGITFGKNFDVSTVTNMSHMFSNCSSLIELSFPETFNTSNVTDMSYMFVNCSNLGTIDLSSFKTDNLTTINYMFHSCGKLTNLNLSGWTAPNLKSMEYTFEYCSILENLDMSSFSGENLTSIFETFCYCYKLKKT